MQHQTKRRRLTAAVLLCLSCLLVLTACQTTPVVRPAHVPDGYQPVFRESFDEQAAMERFVFTDPTAWQYAKDDEGDGYLELHKQSDYKPKHRSPFNIAMIKVGAVGSFVLDVDMKQVGREYGHRDMCVFFGFTDPEHFYYTHMATKGDQNAHQVFIVNDAPRTPITTGRTEGVDWGDDAWRHVRVVRDAQKGEIAVYFDDMDKPVQTAKDTVFKTGYIGFGSFDDVGRVDNIRLWAESIGDEPCEHFKGKK
jgi:hypothetical protein